MLKKIFKVENSIDSNFYKNGKCGLQNMGNTCFLNVIIQCLRHNKYIVNLFISDTYKKYLDTSKNVNDVMCAIWRQLLKDFWFHNNIVIQPTGFITNFHKITKVLNKESFASFVQNDAGEFMQIILDVLDQSLTIKIPEEFLKISGKIKNENDKIQKEFYEYFFKQISTQGISPICKIYQGHFLSSIKTSTKKSVSNTFEPFFYVNLEISNNNSLQDCLMNFTKPERLSGYKNKQYKNESIFYKSFSFIALPDDLIIVLKRFTHTGRKETKFIEYPMELNMETFCSGYLKNKEQKYNLYGVCNHIGNLNGGHYTCFIKNFKNSWVYYNDDTIKRVEEPEKVINKHAYILFYRKCNS